MTRAAVLASLGAWVPPNVVTNADLATTLDTSDEWIRTRTGVAQRHFALPGTATSDLAVEAGARALRAAERPHADTVIVATTTPDRSCPATAPEVAARLGLAGAAAFDVSAVCTGFIYALATAAGLIAAGVGERILVIGAETYSSILNPADRGTAVIFGDGAGAALLRAGAPDEPGALRAFDLGSDGRGSDLIAVPGGGSRQRLSGKPVEAHDQYFTMAGREVFTQAVLGMAASARAVLATAGLAITDIDRVVSHQANIRIVRQLANELRIDQNRMVTNIARVGNTAAASIPLALADAVAEGELRAGDRVLLTAFGGGLTWGSTVLTWPHLADPDQPDGGGFHTTDSTRGAHDE